MLINDLYTNKKPNLSEGMGGQVVFSGTGADGGKYEIIQSGDGFMIHANGRHVDTYGSLQRAMSVLKNEVPGLTKGVAEAETDYQKRRQRERDVDAGKPVKPQPKNPQNDYFARRKKERDMAEDNDAVAAFLARGGEVQQLKPARPRKGERWQGSAHIGSATGRGNTKGRVSGLGANTGKTAKPVVTAEDSVPTHRIGLTVTDPNHPMVSKRKEAYQKSVRVTGHDKEKAINSAIAHHRRKGYQVHDHHYMGTVAEGIDIDPALAAVAKKYPSAHISKDGKVIQKPVDRPYTPPQQDAEKQQRDLTARYPNIDQLVATAEKRRDPYYDRAEGNAYYAGREAEQNYQKLKQIQRVIQGLNESLQKKNLLEFEPVTPVGDEIRSRNSAMINPATQKPYLPSELAGYQSKRAARKAAVATPDPVAEPVAEPVAKPTGVAMPMNPYQVPTARTTPNPTKPVTVPNTAMTTTGVPGFNAGNIGRAYTTPAPELQTIDAPAQLTGPAQAKQLGMANSDITDVVARAPTAKRAPAPNLAALPAPAAPVTPNYGKSVADYSNTTVNAPTASVPNTKSMMPANMMSRTAAAPPKSAVSTTDAKNDIVQALKKLGYKSKEAEAAIRGLPPNISTSDAIRQILRGKPTTTESLTWSKNFDPGRSLYKKMKQDL